MRMTDTSQWKRPQSTEENGEYCIYGNYINNLTKRSNSYFVQSVWIHWFLRLFILTRFSNFKSRNDGNKNTMNFLASPSVVTAMAFSGKLSFNPVTDTITTPTGSQFKFSPPVGVRLPERGFEAGKSFVQST